MFLMIRVPQDNQNFNPRSLAGATTGAYCSIPYVTAISIHAPSRERRSIRLFLGRNTDFNPRSLAGATFQIMVNQPSTPISIHAPSRERPRRCTRWLRVIYFNPRSLAGATARCGIIPIRYTDFNPRSLAGATYLIKRFMLKVLPFQSTLPRGSDWAYQQQNAHQFISIHAPSRERPMKCLLSWRGKYFNPRSLAGATGGNGRG